MIDALLLNNNNAMLPMHLVQELNAGTVIKEDLLN